MDSSTASPNSSRQGSRSNIRPISLFHTQLEQIAASYRSSRIKFDHYQQRLYKIIEKLSSIQNLNATGIGKTIWVSSRPLHDRHKYRQYRRRLCGNSYCCDIKLRTHKGCPTSATSLVGGLQSLLRKIDLTLSSWPWPYPWLLLVFSKSYYCLLTRHNYGSQLTSESFSKH